MQCQQIWKIQLFPQDWKRSIFPISKEGDAKERSNCRTTVLISHASKVMLKILQARLQQYVTENFQMDQLGLKKSRGSRDQIANLQWIKKKARGFQKSICFCFIHYAKGFDCVDHKELWKILQEMGIPDHLTWLLRNLYMGQEATVRTRWGKTDWFKIGKRIWQSYILLPCLFNSHAEYIIRNAGLAESQLESRLPGETSTTSDMQMTPPLWQKVKKN